MLFFEFIQYTLNRRIPTTKSTKNVKFFLWVMKPEKVGANVINYGMKQLDITIAEEGADVPDAELGKVSEPFY